MLPQVVHFKVRRDWQSHIPCSRAPPSAWRDVPSHNPGTEPPGYTAWPCLWPGGSYSPPCHSVNAGFPPELLPVPSPPPKPCGDLTGAGCLQTKHPNLVLHPQIYTKPKNRNAFLLIELSAPAETTAVRRHGVIQPRHSSH